MPANARRDAVFTALLSGRTIKDAARLTTTNEKTIRRWLAEPEFAAELSKARTEISQNVMHGLIATAAKAVNTLSALLDDKNLSGSLKIQSSRTALEFAMRAIEQTAIIERLDELEKNIKNS